MTQADLEKRLLNRKTAHWYISIYRQDDNQFLGLLVDLSDGGFKLTSEMPLESGIEYALQVENPDQDASEKYFQFTAKSLWNYNHHDEYFDTGFEFALRSSQAEALFLKLEKDFEARSDDIDNIELEKYIVEEVIIEDLPTEE